MQEVPNTGMAVTLDIGRKNNIHPPEKIKVGERLSYWALAQTYGVEGLPYSGPVYKSMKTDGNKVLLGFDYAPVGFTTLGGDLNNFEVAGPDKEFFPAEAQITRDKGVVVWSDKVSNPKAVRYCFKDWCEGQLYNTAGLPASSFRTDDWDDIK